MNRRQFLNSTGAFAACAAAFPQIVPSSVLGKDGSTPPSERIGMGFIGVGSMGGGHLRTFLGYPDVCIRAVCDVREEFRLKAKQSVESSYGPNTCAVYEDYRELLARTDIDAVLIAVPDHWHVLIGIEAARQGKHMYSEKPVGRTVEEAKALRAAVRRYGVTFQFGTQQRSTSYYRQACDLVNNGRIGTLHTIMIGSATSQYCPIQPEQPVPSGFNYEMWLGPAPWAPYTFERCTRNWTLIYDYSLGCVSGAWGVHDVDIAQWALRADNTGPTEVEGTGTFPTDNLYDTATSWEVEHKYPNGVKLIHMDMPTAMKRAPEQFSLNWMGMLFQGTDGWVYVSRAGIHARPESILRQPFGPNDVRFPRSTDHRRNFLEAVRNGQDPISPIEAAVRADTVCHQADIAMRLGKRLQWDAVKEEFVNEPAANRMLSRAMRSPWRL